jgi:hypothetical protein
LSSHVFIVSDSPLKLTGGCKYIVPSRRRLSRPLMFRTHTHTHTHSTFKSKYPFEATATVYSTIQRNFFQYNPRKWDTVTNYYHPTATATAAAPPPPPPPPPENRNSVLQPCSIMRSPFCREHISDFKNIYCSRRKHMFTCTYAPFLWFIFQCITWSIEPGKHSLYCD